MASVERRLFVRLSIAVAALSAVAAGIGLLATDPYRDNAFVTAGWLGNDLITLVVVVPLLVVAARLAGRSFAARLVLLGLLDATFYNFAFYLFGAALGPLFLVHAAAASTALVAFVLGVASLRPADAKVDLSAARVRWVAGFLLFVALALSVAEVGQIVAFVTGGAVPAVVARTGHPTHVVAALDLTLVVPFLVIGGVWLWQRRPWGYVIAAIITVKGSVYMLTLSATTLSIADAGFADAAEELPVWVLLGVANIVAARVLFRPASSTRHAGRARALALPLIEGVVGVNAVWGGVMLATDAWDLPQAWLQHTPFDGWLLPGLALLFFVGLGELIAAAAVVLNTRHARSLSVVAGAGLCAWVVVQLVWLRVIHPVMQPTIFVAGAAIAVLAWRMPPDARASGAAALRLRWRRADPARLHV